jgi:hypothetical protein
MKVSVRQTPSQAEVTTDTDGVTLIRIAPAQIGAVRPISQLAKEWGVSLPTLVDVAKRAKILKRAGRQNVCNVQSLVAAFDALPSVADVSEAEPDAESGVSLASIAQRTRGGRP